MNIGRLIRELTSKGVKVETKDNYKWFCQYGNKRGNFFRNGKENTDCCFMQVNRVNDHNDSSSDYTAGWLHKTIKGAVNDMLTN